MSYNKQHLRLEDGALEVRDQDVFHQPLLLDEETVLSEETCLVSDSLKRIGKNQINIIHGQNVFISSFTRVLM